MVPVDAKTVGIDAHCYRLPPWLSFAFYLFFGAIHELIHAATAVVLSAWYADHHDFADALDILYGSGSSSTLSPILTRAILGRYVVLPRDIVANDADISAFVLSVARHAGWIGSVVIAVSLHCLFKTIANNRNDSSERSNILSTLTTAAYATAFESIVTDLLGIVPHHPPAYSSLAKEGFYLFCGNFGVILFNSNWLSEDGGKTALDVMEKMINITQMRGAQCGGVLTYEEKASSSRGDMPQLNGHRSRVVNGKRTDLSKGLRRKVEKDTCNPITGKLHKCNDTSFVKGFFGHTRFATTSKVTFDGCHPHQWTPASMRRVYYSFSPKPSAKAIKRPIAVANFVTHNGDLDFYQINGKNFDLGAIQGWLEHATGSKMPTSVDSCAVAGMVDLLRTQGCFGLSARYAVSFGLSTSRIEAEPLAPLPTYKEYERIGMLFEYELDNMLPRYGGNLNAIASSKEARSELVWMVHTRILPEFEAAKNNTGTDNPYGALSLFIKDEESSGASLRKFVEVTVDAFFDQDLLKTTKEFLANAKGSFGLMISSSLDAHKQICLAARGQSMSIAIYPDKGLVCYGSEQAAVKAGLNYDTPGGDLTLDSNTRSCEEARRLDLDDLGGEICLLDWHYKGEKDPWISVPNRGLKVHKLLSGKLNLAIISESKANKEAKTTMLHHRMTPLEKNEWIKSLPEEPADVVGYDISDIPRALSKIQCSWQEAGLNRLTAWNFSRAIESRMRAIADGTIHRHAGSVDILLTGCEVSLWLAEQFASDLQKAFPKLYIKSTSSNKLLGLYGQDLTVPCIGHPISEKTWELDSPIIIIVSHSGGTFAPLACSNLLQSTSRNIFVVTSEWDTQISKQLRQLYDSEKDIVSSRIFSTDIGVRPAEPCSVSVAATHQLLTHVFEHLCDLIISNTEFRHVSGAIITETDLRTLEKLNRMNIGALEEITGHGKHGQRLPEEFQGQEKALRNIGDRLAEHVLEGAKAYIMSFFYIVITVTIGYPLVTGIATIAGLDTNHAFYVTRFIDSLIYFWLPQINIIILRLLQGRPLRHRMVARTVCIADVPWVAQASEAFLSKLFACSYSIAGLNVISGNPADHLVHRHTHRVVRGSLIVCGRPDGRLSALTSLEATVCLSVNQASSIQSLGSTAETITIGHNPFTLPLSFRGIFLNDHRPKFLCETMLKIPEKPISNEVVVSKNFAMRALLKNTCDSLPRSISSRTSLGWDSDSELDSKDNVGDDPYRMKASLGRKMRRTPTTESLVHMFKDRATKDEIANISDPYFNSHVLLGQYSDMKKGSAVGNYGMGLTRMSGKAPSDRRSHTVQTILADMMKEKAGVAKIRKLFDSIDTDGSGTIDIEKFTIVMMESDPSLTEDDCRKIFEEADVDHSGGCSFEEFLTLAKTPEADLMNTLRKRDRNRAGLSVIQPSEESYFGEEFRKNAPSSVKTFQLAKSQHYAMELYEARIASLQRYVAFCVLFHQLGKRVQDFFPKISFGLLGYRMDRTHSIMRIATTASPVSGADIRERMEVMRIKHTINNAVATISRAWSNCLDRKFQEALNKSDGAALGSTRRRLPRIASHHQLRDNSGLNSSNCDQNVSDAIDSPIRFRQSIFHYMPSLRSAEGENSEVAKATSA